MSENVINTLIVPYSRNIKSPVVKKSNLTSVIIPAYNEEVGLRLVLDSFLENGLFNSSYEIIVVDDGSTDNTTSVAEEYFCRLITHTINKGKGAAMRTGIRFANGSKIIFLDADNTYPVEYIPEIVRQLDKHEIVRGVRDRQGENMPVLNQVGNAIFDSLLHLLHATNAGDVLSGMYGIQKNALLKMGLTSNGFDIETEIVAKSQAHGMSCGLVAIPYNKRAGEKKLNAFRDGLHILYRAAQLALSYNPSISLILPGILVFGMGSLGLLLTLLKVFTVVSAPFASNSTFMFGLVTTIGFQIIVFGLAVYESGQIYGLRGRTNKLIENVCLHFNSRVLMLIGLGLLVLGSSLTIYLMTAWLSNIGPFDNTALLVCGGTLSMLGLQLITSTAFISALKGLHDGANHA